MNTIYYFDYGKTGRVSTAKPVILYENRAISIIAVGRRVVLQRKEPGFQNIFNHHARDGLNFRL